MDRFGTVGIVVVIILILLAVFGYVSNIVKLIGCDFASPYKAEIFRIVGIIMPPVGVIIGYCNLGK